jgi:hypothetical protein
MSLMYSPIVGSGDSARFVRRLLALACTATLLLGSSARASSTVLGFAQINPADVVTATTVAGVTTLSTGGNADGAGFSIPVSINNYLGVPQVPFPIPAFETFVNVISNGPATNIGGTISQHFSGEIEYTSSPNGAGIVYLTATFGPNAVFSGGAGGGSASLNASVPQDAVVFNVPGFDYEFAGFSVGFSGISPALSEVGGSLVGFTAQTSGTFSATLVPEPGTLCMASIAVVMGTLAYGRKKAKSAC